MANFIVSHWLALTIFITPGIMGILIVRGSRLPDPEPQGETRRAIEAQRAGLARESQTVT